MIYTVTFNPALDYVIFTDSFSLGELNRSSNEKIYFGGKGINVSLVLSELGVNSTVLGFLAGFTGKEMEKGIKSAGVNTDFVFLKEGFTRINVKIKSGEETELNGSGPVIDTCALNEFLGKLEGIKRNDYLILAGSVPATLPKNIYETVMERLKGKGVRVVVDAAGELLENTLRHKPFLIKPNTFELSQTVGRKISTLEEIENAARQLKAKGAENVLVSMADKGALLIDENNERYYLKPPKGKVINSVGAGDSMVAGFLAGFIKSRDYSTALRLGTAAGSATAFSYDLAKKKDIEEILNKM